MNIGLRRPDCLPLRSVPDYVSCSVTWQYLGAGTGTLVVDETDPAASDLLAANTQPVPVVVEVGGRSWTGRVASAELQRQGPPGSGTVTATLVDEWAWLTGMLASQSGSSTDLSTMSQFDSQTGPAATVAAYYINAAATRLGAPVLAVPPDGDPSPQVTINARMQTLADLLTGPLSAANVSLAGRLWLPGDAQPSPTVRLAAPTILFCPQPVAAKPWLRWSDTVGGINDVTITVTAPTANRLMLGLNGQDAARGYYELADTGSMNSDGLYGLPEGYADATDVPLDASAVNRAWQEMPARRGKVSAVLKVEDGRPWSFGPDGYEVGDLATLAVAGVDLQERVTRVTVTDDRTGGLVYTPLVGDPAAAATSDELVIRAVSSIATQLRALQTGR